MAFLMKLSNTRSGAIFAVADGPPERDLDLSWDEALLAGPEDDADLDYRSHPVVRARSRDAALDRFVARGLDRAVIETDMGSEEAAASLAVYSDKLAERGAMASDCYFDWMFYRAWFRFIRAHGRRAEALGSHEVVIEGKKPRRVSAWAIDARQRAGSKVGLSFFLERDHQLVFYDVDSDGRSLLAGQPVHGFSGARIAFSPSTVALKSAFGGSLPRLEVRQAGELAEPTLQLMQIATLALIGAAAILGCERPSERPVFQFPYSFGELEFEAEVCLFSRAEVEAFRRG